MALQIESVTTAALSAALDAATRQQAVVAANIANAGTEGYVPLRLSFGEQLAQAREALRQGGLLDSSALETLRGLDDVAAESAGTGGPVQLDVEMVELASNAAHFQALVQGVSRHLSLLGLAAADGRK